MPAGGFDDRDEAVDAVVSRMLSRPGGALRLGFDGDPLGSLSRPLGAYDPHDCPGRPACSDLDDSVAVAVVRQR